MRGKKKKSSELTGIDVETNSSAIQGCRGYKKSSGTGSEFLKIDFEYRASNTKKVGYRAATL